MRYPTLLAPLITGALGLATLGCGTAKPPPAPQAPAAAPSQSPAPVATPTTPANEPAPAAAPSTAPVGKEAPKAAPGNSTAEPSKPPAATPAPQIAKEPTPVPAIVPSKPPAAATPSAAVEPAKVIEAPTASAHAKLGPEKCMMCHRVQYTSWNESKHKTKGLDCEGCHGNGGDYKAIGVMKDRAAAMKAGLILPGLVFCKKCHVKADASMLPLVHAHKAK